MIGNKTIEQLLTTDIDLKSRKLNLQQLATHFQIFEDDFEQQLETLVSETERSKYTLLELITNCKPFVDGSF